MSQIFNTKSFICPVTQFKLIFSLKIDLKLLYLTKTGLFMLHLISFVI